MSLDGEETVESSWQKIKICLAEVSKETVRMAEECLPKQVLYDELAQGRRTLGGQVKRYKDALRMTLKSANIQKDWEKLCEDRLLWRRICNQNNGIFNQYKQRQKKPATGNTKADYLNWV